MKLGQNASLVAKIAIMVILGIWVSPGWSQPVTALNRWDEAHLRAVHEIRGKFANERKPVFDHGLYQDFRLVIQVETNSAPGTDVRPAILRAARESGTKIVLLAGPAGPGPDSWRGVHEGILFLAGSSPRPGGEVWFPEFNAASVATQGGLRIAPATNHQPAGAITHADDALDLWPELGFNPGTFRQTSTSSGTTSPWGAAAKYAGVYPDEILGTDFGGANGEPGFSNPGAAGRHSNAVAVSRGHDEIIVGRTPLDSYEARFRHLTTHVLCRDLSESSVLEALRAGRSYLSHDWLCDPTSFAFVAIHNLGVFTLGDAAPANPLFGGATTLLAATPIPAHLKLYHRNRIIAETRGVRLDFDATDPGPYRVEAWLDVDGVERLWIFSNPIYLDNSIVSTTQLPPSEKPDSVDVKRGIVYTDAPTPDPNKHKLDVYLPKGRTNSPVFFFIHGGAWRLGDRTQFFPVGNRFARDGFVTVIPSYRLAPRSPYPAQIEDCAAAFAWMVREVSRFGGDTNRIFLGGHSAGGHLAALLALDRKQLSTVGLSPDLIKGVIGLSGVYDLNAIGGSQSEVFGTDPKFRRAASPITFVNERAPPFLVTYCEYDYYSLPAQARAFDAALRRAGVKSELWYSPRENHVTEIYSFCLDHDSTADQMLRFMGK